MESTPSAGIDTLKLTGDEKKDHDALQALGNIDAVSHLSPPAARNSPHLNGAIRLSSARAITALWEALWMALYQVSTSLRRTSL